MSNTPKVATQGQLNAAKKLSNDYLYCRTVGHRWDRDMVLPADLPHTGWGTPVGFRCQGCNMLRVDVIDSRGAVSYRIYRQPDGYRIPRKITPRKTTLRLEYLKR